MSRLPTRISITGLAIVSFLSAASSAAAQADRGTITGTVTDSSGGVVANASVKAVHVATNFERTVTTSDQGTYTIPQLQVGAYVVVVTAKGFGTKTVENIELTAGGTARVDETLAVGGLQDAVTVSVETKQIQTDSVKVTTAITSKFIQDLPLVVGGQLRSPLDLSLIAPEAKAGTSGDSGRGNIVIGGGQEGGWDLSVDGISATPGAPFEQRLWTTLNSPSVEAITEFAVDTNGFKAEFGHAGGGAVSFVSRSGSNNWRGKAFEFFRSDKLDTIDYFSKALGRPKPVVEQHDFGGVLGGPIKIPGLYNGRDKSFFFASYEGYRNKTGAAPSVVTIPTAEMYNGDFSNWRDASGNLIPVYDPATTRVNPNGPGFVRDPFPGNQIPLARFSSISRNVLALATMRPDLPGVLNNFTYTSGDRIQTNPWNKFSLKLDHNLSSKDRIGFLFHWGEVLVLPPADGPGGGLPVPLNNFRDEDSNTRVFRANWDRVLTPTLLNRVSFGHNDWFQLRASFNRDQGWGTKIGLRNVPGPDKLFPLIDFSNDYLDWGRSEWGGSGNYLWAFTDDLTWVKASHTWKFGFIVQQDHYDGYGWHTAAGTYNFSRGATSGFLPNGTLDGTGASGNAFASFLLGEVGSSEITTNRYVSDRWRYYSGYAQDDWRISNALTVNYGVRYEYTPPTWEGYYPDGYSNFNPTLPNPGADGRPGASEFAGEGPGRTGKKTMYEAWPWGLSPRLGIVYSVNEDTVVRLSGARIFGSVKNTGGSSHWNGFIGGYNVTAPALPASSAFNWDQGWPSWPEPPFLVPNTLNGSSIPYWQPYDSGRLPEVLLLDTQRTAPVTRSLRRGGWLQRAARATPDDEPSEPQSGRPRALLRLRRAVRAGRRHQSDELAHGLDAGAAGERSLSISVVPRLAVRAAGPATVSAVPRHQHRRRWRRSERTIELPRVRAERREALRVGPDVPDVVRVLEDVLAAVGSRERRRRARDEPLQPRPGEGLVRLRSDSRDQVELQLRAAVRAWQAISAAGRTVEDPERLAHLGRTVLRVGVPLVRRSGLWPAPERRRQSHHSARLRRLARRDRGRKLRSARGPVVGSGKVPSRSRGLDRSAAGLQGRRAPRGVRQCHRSQPARTRPMVPQREHVRRTHVRHQRDATRVPARGLQPVRPQDLGSTGVEPHEPELRARHDARQFAATGAAGAAVRVLSEATSRRATRLRGAA